MNKKMLILRGIAGHFAGRDWPRGALDEASALEYARRRGYEGVVLDVSGETGPHSRQTQKALDYIDDHPEVAALYGFSGGGYNVRHILNALNKEQRERLKLVTVLGAPQAAKSLFENGWELVYRNDPPAGHMAGPRVLLAELGPEPTVVAEAPQEGLC